MKTGVRKTGVRTQENRGQDTVFSNITGDRVLPSVLNSLMFNAPIFFQAIYLACTDTYKFHRLIASSLGAMKKNHMFYSQLNRPGFTGDSKP